MHKYRLCVIVTRLAQLEERSAFNRVVVGSIPTSGDLLLDLFFSGGAGYPRVYYYFAFE